MDGFVRSPSDRLRRRAFYSAIVLRTFYEIIKIYNTSVYRPALEEPGIRQLTSSLSYRTKQGKVLYLKKSGENDYERCDGSPEQQGGEQT